MLRCSSSSQLVRSTFPRRILRALFSTSSSPTLVTPLRPHASVTPVHKSLSTVGTWSLLAPPTDDMLKLCDNIFKGDRRSLSKAITLVESSLPAHREKANTLLMHVLDRMTTTSPSVPLNYEKPEVVDPHVTWRIEKELDTNPEAPIHVRNGGRPSTTLRIGISGTPGVGKSTFIESFGMHLIQKYGLNVAVLTIDPSSRITGGSILGDKTRMQQLSMDQNAFIRPSPSKGTLGGVAQDTAEAVLLCEAAQYDVVIVETVGVGQSEVTVAQTVDMLILLMNPGGGDELQGIKKGIMELADLVVVTKADGDLLTTAQRTRMDYERSLNIFKTAGQLYGWQPHALLCSVKVNPPRHFDRIWGKVLDFEHAMLRPMRDAAVHGGLAHLISQSGSLMGEEKLSALTEKMSVLHAKRVVQRRQWLWAQLSEELLHRMRRFSRLGAFLEEVETLLALNRVTPRVAAGELFDRFISEQAKVIAEAKGGHDWKSQIVPEHTKNPKAETGEDVQAKK